MAGKAYGVRCDDLSCARIEGNQIVGGPAATTYGVVLQASRTLVARNIIDTGCTGTGGTSVALNTTDSYARVENNLIRGSACGGQVYGVWEHLLQLGHEVDLHSNTITGGGVAAGCTGHALAFDVGATTPASPRGLVRNDILQAGPCSGAGYDVTELAAGARPRIIKNNDFAPGIVYHPQSGADLTIDQVNMLSGAAANFSADPMLASDGIHLNAGSMCIDTGTAEGAPPDDYDGTVRPKGAGFDVGMSER